MRLHHLPLSPPPSSRGAHSTGRRGGILIEVSLAMGFTAVLALIVMRASLLALSNNQWTIMQTLTDACLTRETALAHRVPASVLTGADSPWPDLADGSARREQAVSLGRLAGGREVGATLIRFRINETPAADEGTGLSVWRLHSVLRYTVGGQTYVKSRATLRMQ